MDPGRVEDLPVRRWCLFMSDLPSLPGPGPIVPPPPTFVERRTTLRRTSDRLARAETTFLARIVDAVARETPATDRLGDLLALVATATGARRAALLTGDPHRQVIVIAHPDDQPDAAAALGRWLDANAPRPRAARAAAGPAAISVLHRQVSPGGRATVAPAANAPRPVDPDGASDSMAAVILPLPVAGDVHIGLSFARPTSATDAVDRLPAGGPRHLAAGLAAVTRDLRAEAELARLRATEDERGRFVSTVAHELRTPLTGLAGYLDLILEGKVDDPEIERDFLERGRTIVDSIAALVGDLLDASRLESGTLQFELRPFSMAEVVTRVVGALDPMAMERGIALRTSLPPRMRMAVGDRRRVEQILTNLVGNALKFVRDGGAIDIGAWAEGHAAVFAVRDDGGGITAEDRARIFERFYRMATHEKVTGTGLGLPIARDLARAMGGELDVASVPGSGSTFLLALPGPGTPDTTEIAAAMPALMAAEEVALEERAVLRALESAGRALPVRPRPQAEPIPVAPVPLGAESGPSPVGRSRPHDGTRPRLRALDGGVLRAPTPRPSPA